MRGPWARSQRPVRPDFPVLFVRGRGVCEPFEVGVSADLEGEELREARAGDEPPGLRPPGLRGHLGS